MIDDLVRGFRFMISRIEVEALRFGDVPGKKKVVRFQLSCVIGQSEPKIEVLPSGNLVHSN